MSSDIGGVHSQQCEAPGARNPCVSVFLHCLFSCQFLLIDANLVRSRTFPFSFALTHITLFITLFMANCAT